MLHFSTALVLGLGKTGYSVVCFLVRQGITVSVIDNRKNPPYLELLQSHYPDVSVSYGSPFPVTTLLSAQVIISSPGIDLREPSIQQAIQADIPVFGDIDLFLAYVDPKAKIIAITGSNGKSSVTRLVAEMALADGKDVAWGANYGIPALDLLDKKPEIYVLELSSFQLDITQKLVCDAAVVLNISADHMDRYDHLDDYLQAKMKIYANAKECIINDDESRINAYLAQQAGINTSSQHHFSTQRVLAHGYSVCSKAEQVQLIYQDHEQQHLYPPLSLLGEHYYANALASIALAKTVGISDQAITMALQGFKGLEHRCQWVDSYQQVQFYNDSKGTNVGATLAAITGIAAPIILIAGGEGKGADFSELAKIIINKVKSVVLIGKDKQKIAQAIQQYHTDFPLYFADTMQAAVQCAFSVSNEGDMILLSPACASFDMYDNYMQRGADFVAAIKKLKYASRQL